MSSPKDAPINAPIDAPIDAGLSLSERARIIEALVFASAEPVAFKKLAPYLNEETEIADPLGAEITVGVEPSKLPVIS